MLVGSFNSWGLGSRINIVKVKGFIFVNFVEFVVIEVTKFSVISTSLLYFFLVMNFLSEVMFP